MSTNHLYFDLYDHVQSIPNVFVAAQAARDVAWRIDALIISEARLIMRTIREHIVNQSGADSMAETLAMLSEAETAQQWFANAGGSVDGSAEKIRQLNATRQAWHELAHTLTEMNLDWRGLPRRYDIPDLDSVFHRPPNLTVSPVTQRRLQMSCKRIATALNAPAIADKMYERRMQRQVDKMQSMAENIEATAGIALDLARMVITNDKIERDSSITRLPLELQRTLIDVTITAMQRADDFAASERNMSDAEYEDILTSALASTQALQQVLKSSRFTQLAQSERAAEHATG